MAPAVVTFTGLPTSTLASAFAITTTFAPPSQCAQSVGGLTMLQVDGFRIWLNAPLPVPGTTVMSCYPKEFASSFLLQKGGVSQAAFSPLVCPQGYTTQGPYTSNYIACCPSGWGGFAPAPNAPPDRPAFGGTCFTNIFNKPIQITSYDNSAIKASSIFTATGTADQAFAYPYEGFALGVAILASTIPPIADSTMIASSITSPVPTKGSTSPASTVIPVASMSNSSNTTILAIVIVGSITAALFLLILVLFAHNYRKSRMLLRAIRGGKGRGYPNSAAHQRLNNDSPTPMMYLGQPPKVVTDWQGTEDGREGEIAETESSTKHYEADENDENTPENMSGKAETHLHELQGDPYAKRQSMHEMESESGPRKQSVHEMDAAVDAMMEDMVGILKSKKLPALPEAKKGELLTRDSTNLLN